MNSPALHVAVTGAAMDTVVQKNYRKHAIVGSIVITGLMLFGVAWWKFAPRGLPVAASDVRIAAVERGAFLDNIVVRANAAPLNTIMLDSVDSGRVEEIFARDGAILKQGQLLFRLSNPQRHLELLARQSDYATQISNLSNLRFSFETSRAALQRRISENEYTSSQAEKEYARTKRMAERGFVSAAALEEAADKLAQQRRSLEEERLNSQAEIAIKRNAINQMEQALKRFQSGLALVSTTVDALAVRAPAPGRLTDFDLQVGQAVKADQHIGRIDDPDHFKLVAQIDEYYINRVTVGRHGRVQINQKVYEVTVSRIFAQINQGRFIVELIFPKEQPTGISPGQSIDTEITLGDPAQAMLLPMGAFVNDSGGAWAYVVAHDGTSVERRAIRIGRRSNSQIEVLSGVAEGERVIVSSYASFGKATNLQLQK